jgi:serine protease AprX
VAGLLLVLALALPPARASAGTVYVDPALQAILTSASSTDQIAAVVNFDPALTTAGALAGAVQGLGAGTLTFRNLDSLGVLGTAAQINAVAALPGVAGVYANRQLTYLLHESVPYIGAPQAWSGGVTGQGIGVAVLDSGVDATHPDLAFGTKTVQNVKVAANLADVVTFRGKQPTKPLYAENVPNTDTTSGHGTHVAGIAAGSGAASGGYFTGVARGAGVVGIGAGDTLLILWALAGFDYVIENAARYNIKVVNNSWGTSGGAGAYDPEDPISQAAKKAHDKGITVVFAAGNEGPNPDTMNPYAMLPWVVGVAAGCKPSNPEGTQFDVAHCPDAGGDTTSGRGLLADFSSRGVPGSGQFHPTLTAPGAHIVSTRAATGTTLNVLDAQHDLTICSTRIGAAAARYIPSYTCASGTSMAAPHVAGTVALMQQAAGGTLTPEGVKTILAATARPMLKGDGTPYGLWEVGAGYLDAYAAVEAARR